MKIAILQYGPTIGAVAPNFSRAESLLMREEHAGRLKDIDLLVLPELAFTGYNHPSLAAIAPYLEPTADGPSTRWAIRTATRLKCTVTVGYPEVARESLGSLEVDNGDFGGNYNTQHDPKISAAAVASGKLICYNSLVFVDASGRICAHYRKHHLFYSDEIWAKEGSGFYAGIVPLGNSSRMIKCSAGICMDINPYQFTADWEAREFVNHAISARARIIVVSMAWLTHDTAEQLAMESQTPELNTLGYWIERFKTLCDVRPDRQEGEEVIVIFANRTGDEGPSLDPRIGHVRYAGSSTVMGFTSGSSSIRIWDIMGKAQDGMLLVNTDSPPKYSVKRPADAIPLLDEVKETGKLNATVPQNEQRHQALTLGM